MKGYQRQEKRERELNVHHQTQDEMWGMKNPGMVNESLQDHPEGGIQPKSLRTRQVSSTGARREEKERKKGRESSYSEVKPSKRVSSWKGLPVVVAA